MTLHLFDSNTNAPYKSLLLWKLDLENYKEHITVVRYLWEVGSVRSLMMPKNLQYSIQIDLFKLLANHLQMQHEFDRK